MEPDAALLSVFEKQEEGLVLRGPCETMNKYFCASTVIGCDTS
jgi:hypothetical protein